MRIKVSERARAEFDFLARLDLDMIGHEIGVAVVGDDRGHSALECWVAYDTHGRRVACREPGLLAKAVRSKASLNLQVKLWAEDLASGCLLTQRELLGYVAGWPAWVARAAIEQAGKICQAAVGFAPRFARAEFVHGQIWPPDLDGFDPGI